jgi:hypothetical protein
MRNRSARSESRESDCNYAFIHAFGFKVPLSRWQPDAIPRAPRQRVPPLLDRPPSGLKPSRPAAGPPRGLYTAWSSSPGPRRLAARGCAASPRGACSDLGPLPAWCRRCRTLAIRTGPRSRYRRRCWRVGLWGRATSRHKKCISADNSTSCSCHGRSGTNARVIERQFRKPERRQPPADPRMCR